MNQMMTRFFQRASKPRAPRYFTQSILRLYHYHHRSYGECMRKGALTKYRIGANGYFKDFMADGGPKFLAGNLSKRYEQGHCGQARYAVDSAAFQRDNSKNSSYVAGWPLARADFVRDETIAVHAPSIRKAITQEFGPSALQVLRESQAWFREQTRRYLEEGGDPAF